MTKVQETHLLRHSIFARTMRPFSSSNTASANAKMAFQHVVGDKAGSEKKEEKKNGRKKERELPTNSRKCLAGRGVKPDEALDLEGELGAV